MSDAHERHVWHLGRQDYESLLKRVSDLEAKVQPIHDEYTEFEERRAKLPSQADLDADAKDKAAAVSTAAIAPMSADDSADNSSEDAAGDSSGNA